ncbi:MAG: hypothetical protein Q7S26_00145 [bacterium]|nr:hypothetical protein [bacterium]
MEVSNLVLYSIQQLGVMFAVGAQTVILVAYLLAIRNGIVDEQEERFSKAVKRVLFVGLFLIVISGLAITALELLAAHRPIVFSPAYLFKWCLIGMGVVLARATWGISRSAGLLEGVAGATWYALFAVHILAPVATWPQLLTLFSVWLIVFVLGWTGLVFGLRGKRAVVEASVAKEKNTKVLKTMPAACLPVGRARQAPVVVRPIQPTRPIQPVAAFIAPMPKVLPHVVPVVPFRPTIPENLPVFTTDAPLVPQPPQVAQAVVVEQKVDDPNSTPGLPHIRVMPKTIEELQKILAHI